MSVHGILKNGQSSYFISPRSRGTGRWNRSVTVKIVQSISDLAHACCLADSCSYRIMRVLLTVYQATSDQPTVLEDYLSAACAESIRLGQNANLSIASKTATSLQVTQVSLQLTPGAESAQSRLGTAHTPVLPPSISLQAALCHVRNTLVC